MYRKFLFNMVSRQWSGLQHIQQVTGLTPSEVTRRMYDWCLCEQTLNEMIPAMSGQFQRLSEVMNKEQS